MALESDSSGSVTLSRTNTPKPLVPQQLKGPVASTSGVTHTNYLRNHTFTFTFNGCVCTCNLRTVGKRVGTEESLGSLVTNLQVLGRALSQRNTVAVTEHDAQCPPLEIKGN